MGSWVTPAAASVKSPEELDPAPCRLCKWDCYLANRLTQQQGECFDPCVPSATTSPDTAGVQAGGRGAAVGRDGVVFPLLLQAFIRFCEQHESPRAKQPCEGSAFRWPLSWVVAGGISMRKSSRKTSLRGALNVTSTHQVTILSRCSPCSRRLKELSGASQGLSASCSAPATLPWFSA